jgi:hypothetical protein
LKIVAVDGGFHVRRSSRRCEKQSRSSLLNRRRGGGASEAEERRNVLAMRKKQPLRVCAREETVEETDSAGDLSRFQSGEFRSGEDLGRTRGIDSRESKEHGEPMGEKSDSLLAPALPGECGDGSHETGRSRKIERHCEGAVDERVKDRRGRRRGKKPTELVMDPFGGDGAQGRSVSR